MEFLSGGYNILKICNQYSKVPNNCEDEINVQVETLFFISGKKMFMEIIFQNTIRFASQLFHTLEYDLREVRY